MRPLAFDELEGQTIWHSGSALWELVAQDRFHSLILWGPPGTGKTSLALMIGSHTGREVVLFSATSVGVKEIRAVLQRSEEQRSRTGKGLVLFMDEIHRLSKSQQDVLLPGLESGQIKFIGATTENPSFEVNNAVLSRSLVFRFERLTPEALLGIMKRSLGSNKAIFAGKDFPDATLEIIARAADGDARRVLNLLESLAAIVPQGGEAGPQQLEHLAGSGLRRHDKQGDMHYDLISAMIKSVRASHPDAAIYYVARLLDAGEDPMFVARRLVILATEDIGNANPTALLVATSGMQAVHMIGMPEARILLAQVTTYLAASPKSNRAYLAINKALDDVKTTGSLEVPLHLSNGVTGLMREFGHGKGYAYAHDDPKGARQLEYLPRALRGRRYYEPSEQGTERQLRELLQRNRPERD